MNGVHTFMAITLSISSVFFFFFGSHSFSFLFPFGIYFCVRAAMPVCVCVCMSLPLSFCKVLPARSSTLINKKNLWIFQKDAIENKDIFHLRWPEKTPVSTGNFDVKIFLCVFVCVACCYSAIRLIKFLCFNAILLKYLSGDKDRAPR